ncbi:MAG: hypothetical protein DHS20C11_24470 [Lysobacteraceae bacterium]|nr:MAG: hypothetical protein DHS20C11_24470 [Xanthomonadaceae bacterium]
MLFLRNLGLVCMVSLLFGVTAAQADCTAKAGNEVGNCGFEDPLGSTWTLAGSTISRNTSVQRSGAASLEIDGSFVVDVIPASGGATSACFTLTADGSYGRGGFVRLADPRPMGATDVSCTVTLVRWSMPGCTGSATQIPGNSAIATTSGWEPIVNTTVEAATSAEIQVFCTSLSPSADFTIYVDDVFAGPSLLPVELQSFEVN